MTRIDYAAATFWYGKPGAKVVDGPTLTQITEEAKAPVQFHSPKGMPNSVTIPGFTFKQTPPGYLGLQRMSQEGYRDEDHVWWTGTKAGDVMDLVVHLEKSGSQKLIFALTQSWDYGKLRFLLNGKAIGEFDGYSRHIARGEFEIGTVDAPSGEHTLSIEVIGKNEQSTGTFAGFDYFRFE